MGESWRRWSQPPGNALGLLLAVEELATHATSRLAVEGNLKPFRYTTLPTVFDAFRATVEGVRDRRIGPVRSLRIGLAQNTSAKPLLGRYPLLFDQTVQTVSLTIC